MNHHRVQPEPSQGVAPPTPLPAIPAHPSRGAPRWLGVACACAAAFALGFWVGDRRVEARATELARERFGLFLIEANRLGILDRGRIDEIICIGTEAAWESDTEDAAVP